MSVPIQYKTRYYRVADVVHWSLCLKCASRCYEHRRREHPVMENEEVEILWDFSIESDRGIVYRWPHIVVLEKKEKNALLINIGVPGDVKVEEKEEEKVTKYQCLAREVKRLWQLKSVNVIPVVVGALGTIRKLEVYVEKGGIEVSGGLLQKVALLGQLEYCSECLERMLVCRVRAGIVSRLVVEARTMS